MTFGQMKQLTDRFNQIRGGSQQLKNRRLKSLAYDLEQKFAERGLFYDTAAYRMHQAVLEEMGDAV